MISSTSVVSSTSGIESSPPKVLNRTDLPSMTGSDALAPMSPRPSTAVPSLTTTTSLSAHVYRFALAASSAIARLTFATPGVYATERSRGEEIGRVAATESLPPSWPSKISVSVTGVVIVVPVIASAVSKDGEVSIRAMVMGFFSWDCERGNWPVSRPNWAWPGHLG